MYCTCTCGGGISCCCCKQFFVNLSIRRIYTVKYLILKSRDVSRSRLHLCGNITDWKAQWCFGVFQLVMRMRGTPMQTLSSFYLSLLFFVFPSITFSYVILYHFLLSLSLSVFPYVILYFFLLSPSLMLFFVF